MDRPLDPLAICEHPRYDWRLVNELGQVVKNTNNEKIFKRWVQVPCARPSCPCVECRKTWARNEAAILLESFKELPPSHFTVLRNDTQSPDELWACFTRFAQACRDLRKQGIRFEYTVYIQGTSNSSPHLHLLVRTDTTLKKTIIRDMWAKACCSDNVTVYFEAIRNANRAALYVTKHWFTKTNGRWRMSTPWQPPQEWKGHKLHTSSRGFWSKQKDLLWEDVKRSWFPEGEIDWGKYEQWTPPVATPKNNVSHGLFTWDNFVREFTVIEKNMSSGDGEDISLDNLPSYEDQMEEMISLSQKETTMNNEDELIIYIANKAGNPLTTNTTKTLENKAKAEAQARQVSARIRYILAGVTSPEKALAPQDIADMIPTSVEKTVKVLMGMADVVRLDGWKDHEGYCWWNKYHLRP